MSNYAILRTEKLKTFGNIGGSLSHTFRDVYTPNADSKLLKENKVLIGSYSSEEVLDDIKKRISEITDKPRKNGVLTIEVLQTYSPNSKVSLPEWEKKNVEWLKNHFGEKNVISCVLHKDESTPHIVSYVVPEKNGKLNCREILGGREKLQKMQDSYANSMKSFKLQRGVKNSKAEHITVKKYYSKINNAEKASFSIKKELPKIKPPPEKRIFQTSKSRLDELEKWNSDYKKQYNNISRKFGKAYLDTQMLKMENDNLKEQNSNLLEKIGRLENMINYEDISKDDIKILRKIDITKVAERLNYFGEIKPKENAIDLVNRVNNFQFQASVEWLYNEFGQDVTGAEVANYVDVKKPERPFSPAENKIKNEVDKQLDALGCDKYRITLQSDNKKPFLPGKFNNQENFYTKNDVKNMIPYLLYQNNQGMNVLITPMDENAYYILLDDSKLSKEQLEKNGYKPCLYQNTSWNSSQAIFKISKENFDREKDVIPFFNKFNKRFGDEKITGLRHPFRLAGFRNMKEKHLRENGKRPFVELKLAINRFCTKCMEIIQKSKNNDMGGVGVEKPNEIKAFKPK